MKKIALILLTVSIVAGCNKDENGNLSVNISGLEDLGANYKYEGWIMVDGTPVSTGVFSVDASGAMSTTSFEMNQDDIDAATAYILTIEPSPDTDASPSSTHILAGDFSGGSANLSIGHAAALGDSYASAAGSYILATPTNGMPTNENSGIWWLDLSSGSPTVALTLPTLPAGWVYEGWTVINGTPVTTGTFTAVDVVDNADPYSSTMPGPPFPGEDFLENAPSGLTFPTDIAGGTAVISIEPSPDNSTMPFLLKPLVGMIPANATDHLNYQMNNNAAASSPTGSATR